MRFDRIIIAACILFALTACKNEKPVYVTVNEEFDIVVDNTTESVRVVIEGGFNPHVKQVVSNADWLKADYLGTIKLGEFKDPETGFYWLGNFQSWYRYFCAKERKNASRLPYGKRKQTTFGCCVRPVCLAGLLHSTLVSVLWHETF